MHRELRRALSILAAFTLITGLVYPALVTLVAQIAAPGAANGSIIERRGKPVGSALIGQPFSGPKHFWSRPSATTPYPYNAASSSGSNLGPSNGALAEAVAARAKVLLDAGGPAGKPIPVDLVTASASGLDPHISLAAAEYQVARVAAANGLTPEVVRAHVARATEQRQFGLLGEPRVNVLRLNLDLDSIE